MRKYLFIVCPNQSGSSLIYRMLNTSKKIKKLSTEGQLVDGYAGPINQSGKFKNGIFSEYREEFSNPVNYNWGAIKDAWTKDWSNGIGSQKILLEKSPPNVFKAKMLEENFKPSYFIVSIRNPYAMCEGMKRRINYPVNKSAIHWGECARQQIENIKTLKNMIWFKYEEFCANPKILLKIQTILPELDDIKLDELIAVHSIDDMAGVHRKKIKNYNEKQINNLTENEILKISKELREYKDEMNFFNYKIMGE